MKQLCRPTIIFWILIFCFPLLPASAQLGILPIKDESRLTGISVDLLQLEKDYLEYFIFGGNPQTYVPPHPLTDYENGSVRLEIITRNDGASVLPLLQLAGLQEGVAFKRVINGTFPILMLNAIPLIPNVLSVQMAYLPSYNTGSATSQGDFALNTDAIRDIYNLSGQGVTVGVMSDSYNHLQGEVSGVASGDLPGPGNPNGYNIPVNVLSENSGVDEGRAMLEIVHDLAPEARLAFHSAKGGKAAFAKGILALADEGQCDVIVDDIVYSSSAYFQDGIVAQAVDSVVKQGVAYFTSAGNQGDFSYESAFMVGDSFTIDFVDRVGNEVLYPVIRHDFGGGDYLQSVTLYPGGSVKIVLQWDDAHTGVSGLPGPQTDLDLFITSEDGNEIVAASINTNYLGNPVELISYTNTSGAIQNLNLVIGLTLGPPPANMKYIYYGGMQVNESFSGGSTIFGHANAEGAIAVGAVTYGDTPNYGNPDVVPRNYSSHGGMPILFDTSGQRIESVIRSKPNILATDGVDNSFFGADSDNNGFPNFFGTSAAAPHAAAVVALLREMDPTISPARIRTLLENTSVSSSGANFSFTSGWGLIEAIDAAFEASKCATFLHISGDDSQFPQGRVQSAGIIETDLNVLQQLELAAGRSVRLKPGFQVRSGAYFSAHIAPPDCPEDPQKESNDAPLAGQPESTFSLVDDISSVIKWALNAFPNPFGDRLVLEYEFDQPAQVSLKLMDGLGNLVAHPLDNVRKDSGVHSEVLDVQALPAGLYVVLLEVDGQVSSRKLMKQ